MAARQLEQSQAVAGDGDKHSGDDQAGNYAEGAAAAFVEGVETSGHCALTASSGDVFPGRRPPDCYNNAGGLPSQLEKEIPIMPNITLEQAELVLGGAKAAALELGKAFSFSVVDARGDLITMCKMDGSAWRTPYVSRGKARASACFGEPSGDLTERSTTPIMRAVMEVERGEFVPGQGALPIYMDGELIGAVGGSGGTAQEDEDCSRAGIARLTGASAGR